jgi:hypothetical protein
VETLECKRLLAGDLACAASYNAGDNDASAYVAGDANRDGSYDPADVKQVLQSGKYSSDDPADWSEGDWNGDDTFDQDDLVAAVNGWPDAIRLPPGFESEGIELGNGHDFYLSGTSWSGTLASAGAVYKGNLCTGEGEIIAEATGKPLVGLSFDARTNRLYGASGDPGAFGGIYTNRGVNIYDGTSGQLIEEVMFGDGSVTNDILVTKNAVYVTDSVNPTLFKIPLDDNGQRSGDWETVDMNGFVMDRSGVGFNANGLVGDFDGTDLVVVNSNTGVLYHVATDSENATPIDIQGDEQVFFDGDGLYMEGRTLYVLQNGVLPKVFPAKIAVLELSEDLTQGTFVRNIVSDSFAVPTTIRGFGDSIYAINTHFCEITPVCGRDPASLDPLNTQTEVVRVDKVDAAFRDGDVLLGDADGDGEVAFADFLIVSKNFGSNSAALADGDFNDDDNVDFADFLLLAMNFGRSR